ncbi:MAG: nitroreductase [Sandaracinaceae bacterium]|nr:nitroreductase [Sandaracinaceae bacterium]
MDAIELLETRASQGKLTAPAPDDAALAAIVDAALRAPDHGALRPWRVLAIRGEGLARLGALFAGSLARKDPAADAEALRRAADKALRAPLVVVIAATPRLGKIPEIEQVLAAGALAHGILLGLHARGFGGIWRTGDPAYDPEVKRALGLAPEDHLVAFLYCGTPAQPAPAASRPKAADLLRRWP